jgi:2-polyprenyl-3-methyl-5-hydroxy-6-metoxy-1,4-benzoquinol methylase
VDDIFPRLGFNASIIHDLNKPVPKELEERFDVVLDGGLEHVFDFPQAIENAMRMTKIGGHLILETPANNLCGNGFYQFSPELFFRVLDSGNGFELERLYLASKGKYFSRG